MERSRAVSGGLVALESAEIADDPVVIVVNVRDAVLACLIGLGRRRVRPLVIVRRGAWLAPNCIRMQVSVSTVLHSTPAPAFLNDSRS